MIPISLHCTPAYGRDYRSAKAARESFLGGEDWVVQPEGSYVSWSDIVAMPEGARPQWINLRFKKMTGVAVIEVAKEARKVEVV